MDAEGAADDLQSKVLQNTLAEVAARNELGSEGQLSEPCCVICLDSITDACEARPCRHRNFDYVCLLNWLERLSKCPLCKSNIHEVGHDFGYDGPGTSRVYLVPQVTNDGRQNEQRQPQPQAQPGRAVEPWGRSRHAHFRHQPVTEDRAIVRRQQIYRNRLYSLHVGSNRKSRYRDITPALFESEPQLVSRARAWLRRELQVFAFLRTPNSPQSSDDAITRRRANNAEFLLEYIIAILKTVDIQGSQGVAEDLLTEFLGRENTKLLLHELRNYLRSPWSSIEAWDRNVQYPSSTGERIKYEDGDNDARGGRSGGGSIRTGDRLGQGRTRGDSYRPAYSRGPYDRRSIPYRRSTS